MNVGVIIPCYNEENYIDRLLKTLSNAIQFLENPKDIIVILCDNGSEDNTVKVIESHKALFPSLVILHENEKGTGLAMAKAAHAAFNLVDWIISLDSDCTLPIDWVLKWIKEIKTTNLPILTGWCKFPNCFLIDFPNAGKILNNVSSFNNFIVKKFGIINICGANHAISKSLYYKIGGYTQPYVIENGKKKIIAGVDWDFGTKTRMAKQEIGFADVFNETSDRRLAADAKGFVAGTAYEGVLNSFRKREIGKDISKMEMKKLYFENKLRTVKHFALKPILVDNSLLNNEEVVEILGKQLINEMSEWMSTNIIINIYNNRNGFIYGSLEEFHKVFGLRIYKILNNAVEK